MEAVEEVLVSDPQVDLSSRTLSRRGKESVEKAAVDTLDEDGKRKTNDIFRDLQTYRVVKSKAAGIPLLGIFSRGAAQNISISKPSSVEELLQIRGVGRETALRFGEDILEIIHNDKFSKNALEGQMFSIERRKSDGTTTFPERAYLPWSEGEEAELRRMHQHEKTHQEISECLRRTLGAVISRASKLELKKTR